MPRKLAPLLLLLAAASCWAAPSTYDQRQDGDVNVKVDLDNFVILVARPVSALDVFGSMSQLFADSKSSRLGGLVKEPEAKSTGAEEGEKPKEELGEAEPVAGPAKAEEPERTGAAAATQEAEKAARSLEGAAKALRSLRAKDKAKSYSGKYKFVEAVEEPQSLKLIGDAIENCGPGRSRDRLGICQEDVAQ